MVRQEKNEWPAADKRLAWTANAMIDGKQYELGIYDVLRSANGEIEETRASILGDNAARKMDITHPDRAARLELSKRYFESFGEELKITDAYSTGRFPKL